MTRRPKPNPDDLRLRILEYCQTLRLPIGPEDLDAVLSRAGKEHFSHLQLVHHLLALPTQRRRERSAELRIQNAKFHDPTTLETFDWKFNAEFINRLEMEELASGDFIRRRDNVVFVGQSGLGKSHLIQALGRRCCTEGYRVRYTTSAALLHDLGTALADGTMPKKVRYYAGFELLIIDEFGFDKLERENYPQASSLLYKVIDSRTRKRSTALVTNVDFEIWGSYLEDPPMAMALLDRLVDTAIIHRFQGKSYRAHRAKRRPAAKTSPAEQ